MKALVQVSLSEAQTAGILGQSFRPDSIIALQSDPFSGVLCVEVDEGTERSAVIRGKLDASSFHLRPRDAGTGYGGPMLGRRPPRTPDPRC